MNNLIKDLVRNHKPRPFLMRTGLYQYLWTFFFLSLFLVIVAMKGRFFQMNMSLINITFLGLILLSQYGLSRFLRQFHDSTWMIHLSVITFLTVAGLFFLDKKTDFSHRSLSMNHDDFTCFIHGLYLCSLPLFVLPKFLKKMFIPGKFFIGIHLFLLYLGNILVMDQLCDEKNAVHLMWGHYGSLFGILIFSCLSFILSRFYLKASLRS